MSWVKFQIIKGSIEVIDNLQVMKEGQDVG
jgi:hypothetical protein